MEAPTATAYRIHAPGCGQPYPEAVPPDYRHAVCRCFPDVDFSGPEAEPAFVPALRPGSTDTPRREPSELVSGHANGRRSLSPRTFTATDLMAMELPPVRWVVPDILPEGVTLLAGKPKVKKSWMGYGLAVAVASGGVALGIKRVEQGEVLYLALEDNRRRLQKRLTALLAGSDAPDGLCIATEWPRLDDGGLEALENWLRAHPNARLIVIDTLKKIRPRTSGNRSVYDVDYESLEPLLPIAAEYGVAILVVHHLRKMDADDPLDTISGSTGLTGGVDGVLVLKKDRSKADATLLTDGRDIEEPTELALTWDQNIASWSIAGDAEEFRLSQTRTEIIGVLEDAEGPMTPTEVSDALGKSLNTIKQRLWHMSKEGQLNAADGRYAIPRNPRNPVTEDENGYGVTGVTGSPERRTS
jgi:hypothetical protein